MNSFKKVVMGMSLLIAASLVQAEEAKWRDLSPGERAAHHTERMTEKLGLSSEQEAQVEAINLKYADKIAALRSESESERKEKRKAIKALFEEKDKELKAVLTEEQYQQYREHKKAMHKKMKHKRNERREESED